jgi:hypothetical protein
MPAAEPPPEPLVAPLAIPPAVPPTDDDPLDPEAVFDVVLVDCDAFVL